jgi:CRISPR-associated endonuclease/helicase Cas3
MLLAGLVSVADWIGSNSNYFPCLVKDFNQLPQILADQYYKDAQHNAHRALSELHWLNWPLPDNARSFPELFPMLKDLPLRAVQQAALEVAESLTKPGLVIIEAPMGEGKTEAAMYLADHWNAHLKQRGIYFALPTQATSNQMFSRVHKFLNARFEGKTTLLQLLHGHAALSAEFETLLKSGEEELQIDNVYDDNDDSDHHCPGKVVAAEWFTHRKRGLLAPFGVGTVDQALMAVLQTKHVFVRLFGLAHKTIIIDEVHAYDAYMSTLLARLLEWLAALGSPVILLSATLPNAKRKNLLQAYEKGLGKKIIPPAETIPISKPEIHYPCITWITKDFVEPHELPIESQSSRLLKLRWLNGAVPTETGSLFQVREILQKQLANGGCAAVICNTVDRAQKVYQELKPFFADEASDGFAQLDLLHARCLFHDRANRELRTLIRFGKPNDEVIDRAGNKHKINRPYRAVLVSTQIIEQSLDLDFDLIITDIAPIDLLLQRAGREWRHKRQRPKDISEPILWLCQPEEILDSVPNFGINRLIYNEHILLRSWLTLLNRDEIHIPGDVEELIESVYDGARICPVIESPELKKFWQQTRSAMIKDREKKEAKAKPYCILPPNRKDLLAEFNLQLEEDSPNYHRTLQAQTRDDDNISISAVFLKLEEKHLLTNKPNKDFVRKLLERSVSIAKRGAAEALLAEKLRQEWKDSPLLRHHRLIEIDCNGSKIIGDFRFILDRNLGVVIENIKEENR